MLNDVNKNNWFHMKKLLALSVCMALAGCTANQGYYGRMSQDSSHIHYNTPTELIEEGSVEQFVMLIGDRVLFALNSYNLSQNHLELLQAQAEWLNKNTDYHITIEGHCDERGTREYNIALGEKRAHFVKNYLVHMGVEASRINVVSYGKEKPEVEGSNEEAWRLNRRAVTRIQR